MLIILGINIVLIWFSRPNAITKMNQSEYNIITVYSQIKSEKEIKEVIPF